MSRGRLQARIDRLQEQLEPSRGRKVLRIVIQDEHHGGVVVAGSEEEGIVIVAKPDSAWQAF